MRTSSHFSFQPSFPIFSLIRIIVLVLAILAGGGCVSYDSGVPPLRPKPNSPLHLDAWIWISEDPTLKVVLKDRFEGDLFTRPEDDFSKIANIEVHSVRTRIRSDRSILFSLASLTLGTFEEMESEFTFEVKYLDGIKMESKKFQSHTRMTLRTPMPPYIGLGATLVLAGLDRHRTPEALAHQCSSPTFSLWRDFLEADRDWSCQEYKKFLRMAWSGVEAKIEQDLHARSLRGNR